jgi:3-hydroxybutyryl-CoA dehydrogenase
LGFPSAQLTVAIIGAGPLGRWLAIEAARAGFRVVLEDVMPANLHHAQEALRQQLGRQSLSDPEGEPGGVGTSRGVQFVSTVEDAVREADLAIDCVPDELESKLEIFCLLDRMAPPRTVLATPTQSLSIADLASCTYRADRCLAIAADPRTWHKDGSRELTLRRTKQTTEDAVLLAGKFWEQLGFVVTMEVDSAE